MCKENRRPSIELLKSLIKRTSLQFRHAQYDDVSTRTKSFLNFPKENEQSHKLLAMAGLFYIDIDDITMCHRCGGGIKQWGPNDDPWNEHEKFYENCPFLHDDNNRINYDETKENEEEYETGNDLIDYQDIPSDKERGLYSSKMFCKQCKFRFKNIVLIPCGHVVSCDRCFRHPNQCPVCNRNIKDTSKFVLKFR